MPPPSTPGYKHLPRPPPWRALVTVHAAPLEHTESPRVSRTERAGAMVAPIPVTITPNPALDLLDFGAPPVSRVVAPLPRRFCRRVKHPLPTRARIRVRAARQRPRGVRPREDQPPIEPTPAAATAAEPAQIPDPRMTVECSCTRDRRLPHRTGVALSPDFFRAPKAPDSSREHLATYHRSRFTSAAAVATAPDQRVY
jgi:hypothetical protein